LKPDNILLDRGGNAYLADFGIAKDMLGANHTQTGTLLGSTDYISPEQIKGVPLTPQADIYSLGVVLFELLTGRKPFEGLMATVIYKHLNEDLPLLTDLNPDLPPYLDIIIQNATRKDANDRYPDVLTLAQDFRAALATSSRDVSTPQLIDVSEILISESEILR